MHNIVKFPYDACRRIHSRKPRRSKNGTSEERAAKAGPATSPTAAVVRISRGNVGMAPAGIHAACPEAEIPVAAVAARLRRKRSSATEDPIFGYIAGHRAAVADGHASAAETYTRCLIIGGAATRKGTIALAKYLAEQIQAPVRGGIHLASQIDGKPWVEVFLTTVARDLRRMGSEFATASKK
jgi:hypothetical protein